ncbi:succinate dehydrogenase (ubiquinone) flavoprotein subunit, partial [[Emmonsia] crescens]
WENPRVPDTQQQQQQQQQQQPSQIDTSQSPEQQHPIKPLVAGGYDPAIHGDYDPTAPYAQVTQQQEGLDAAAAAAAYSSDPNYIYTATGTFNRFTGKWQQGALAPENFNDENKSKRQMNAYFDVDAAANSHDGKSLKAERSGKRLTKKELKAFKEKRRERKEEKRRAWLRD